MKFYSAFYSNFMWLIKVSISLFSLASLLVGLAEPAHAQPASTVEPAPQTPVDIYNCGGTWQNRPCDTVPISKLPATAGRKDVSVAQARSKRRLWLHDLEMLRLRAKREFGIDVNIREATEVCNDENSTDLDCQESISSKELLLQNSMHQAEAVAIEKQKIELEREKLKIQTESQSSPTIVNVENDNRTIVFVKPRGHHLGNKKHNLPPSSSWGASSSSIPKVLDTIPPPKSLGANNNVVGN